LNNKILQRCPWVDLTKPDYIEYHDREWGVPIYDDGLIFEFLTLESAQAGLSWYSVLRKRENYRIAFDQFNPEKVALYDAGHVELLMQNSGIIRNRKKILAAIGNAKIFLKIQEEYGSFSDYIWQFVKGKPIVKKISGLNDYKPTSTESDALSKDVRERGFKFMGSIICHAHMQGTGMINGHTVDCFRRKEIINSYNGLEC